MPALAGTCNHSEFRRQINRLPYAHRPPQATIDPRLSPPRRHAMMTGMTGRNDSQASADKASDYDLLQRQIESAIEGLEDNVSIMATVCAILLPALSAASFVGFYRVVAPDLLRIGPYQGPLACLEITFGRGVCGTAAQTETSQVVEDVEAFPGHIACDPTARSEIVIPVHDADGHLAAVLDIDSRQTASFDETDRIGLERIVAAMAPNLICEIA